MIGSSIKLQDLIQQLEAHKAQLIREIRNYPPPIPACDAQFNYLLEKRDHLSLNLNRLYQLSSGAPLPDEDYHALEQFLNTIQLAIHD